MSEREDNLQSKEAGDTAPKVDKEPDDTSTEQSQGAEGSSQETQGEQQADGEMEFLTKLMEKVSRFTTGSGEEAEKPKILDEINFEGIAKYIKEGKAKNIVIMTGAGISTSAGIPDFRSPGSGLYDNLQKYNLPNPQAIFELGYFKENPEPFFTLSKELYPGNFKPTPCHYFIKMLSDKQLLLRNYTQNIDTLERVAGVPGDKMVEAHGTFHTGHCLGCNKEYTHEWMRDEIFDDKIPSCTECEGVVKPDIVFFGEALPGRFFGLVQKDFPKCDLLLIMGTSLVVQPFASLVSRVSDDCPRLLINKEKCGQTDPLMQFLGMGKGLEFDSPNNYRDVAYEGDCDDGCIALADMLGWKDELMELIKTEHTRIDADESTSKMKPKSTPVKTKAEDTSAAGNDAASNTEKKEEIKKDEIPSEKL
ncbi:NAD-dependent protein deacetylase sirtuin-2-like [Glandiceps talaboti]